MDFLAGASGSASSSQITETQKNVCASGFDSSKYSSQASQFARNVYQGSLDAWNKCQKLAQDGVNFDLQVNQSMQGATVTLSTSSAGSTVNFNGLDQIGLGRSICTTTRNSSNGSSTTSKVLTVDKTTSLKFNSGSKLTITCERQMSSDGKGGLFADAQTLVFNTSAGAYQVPMVAIGLTPRVTVEEAVASLQADTNAKLNKLTINNQNSISQVSTSLESSKLNSAGGAICRDIATDANHWGDGNAVFLDRHNLQCNDDEYLTRFYLNRPSATTIRLNGRCCKVWK
jgi:hypothetical protein